MTWIRSEQYQSRTKAIRQAIRGHVVKFSGTRLAGATGAVQGSDDQVAFVPEGLGTGLPTEQPEGQQPFRMSLVTFEVIRGALFETALGMT